VVLASGATSWRSSPYFREFRSPASHARAQPMRSAASIIVPVIMSVRVPPVMVIAVVAMPVAVVVAVMAMVAVVMAVAVAVSLRKSWDDGE
jgi:hypothetical protein